MRAESGRDVQALSNSFNARFNYLYLYTMKKALLILLTLLTLISMGYSQNSSINSEENRIATNDVFVYCEQKNEKPVLDLKGRMLYYVVQENKFEIYSGKTFSDAVAAGKLEVSVNFTIVENGIILEGRNRNVQYNFDDKGNLKGEKIMGVGMMFKRANEKFIPKIEIQAPPILEKVLTDNFTEFKNHVFALMDENSSPFSIHGQFTFIVIHDNNKIQFLLGSSLSQAIKNGIQKEGHWENENPRYFSYSWNDAPDKTFSFEFEGIGKIGKWKQTWCILDCVYLKDLGKF